jgi:pimeloyl-ACP methyl ester carboxylesterase
MHGAHSRVTRNGRGQRIADNIAGARGSIAIPEAHHHLMLDQPLALISALRAVLF